MRKCIGCIAPLLGAIHQLLMYSLACCIAAAQSDADASSAPGGRPHAPLTSCRDPQSCRGHVVIRCTFLHLSSLTSWLAHTVPQQSISRLPVCCGETMDADVDVGNACVLYAVDRTSTATPELDARGLWHQYPFHPLNYNYTCSVAGPTQHLCWMSDPCDSRVCYGGGSRVLSTTK